MSKVIEDQTFALKVGEWTTPIRTREGFIVEEVTEHTPAGVQPLSAVEEQVMEGIYQDAIQPALRTYLTDLREKAYIDVAPGFVDTGASPKETKPVFASTAPPVVKKKRTQKARLDQSHAAAAAAAPANVASAAPDIAATAGAVTAKSAKPSAKTVNTATGKKPKIHREKIRFGQAPQNSLPAAPEETLTPGADQGTGASSVVEPAPGTAISSMSQQASTTDDEDPLAPKTVSHGKTRYSDRAPIEAKQKAIAKAAKVKQKIAATPAPLTPEEKAALQEQNAPLGLNGDTATKKKKKREKGAPKERIQEKAPTPPAPKPEPTPIPPKGVRDNGEPVVSPPPANLPPPVTPPADPQSTPAPAPPQ
jgi:peptidyl-prolyl cis-trans isomerase SurA